MLNTVLNLTFTCLSTVKATSSQDCNICHVTSIMNQNRKKSSIYSGVSMIFLQHRQKQFILSLFFFFIFLFLVLASLLLFLPLFQLHLSVFFSSANGKIGGGGGGGIAIWREKQSHITSALLQCSWDATALYSAYGPLKDTLGGIPFDIEHNRI